LWPSPPKKKRMMNPILRFLFNFEVIVKKTRLRLMFLKRILLLFLIALPLMASAQSFDQVLSFIKTRSDIREGGCDLFQYNGQNLLVAVSPVAVGTKSELNCKKVGGAKAKRDMLSFINGSEITSCTQLTTSEKTSDTLKGQRVELEQSYCETIRERVVGEINMTVPLGGWYSEDRSVYYYALYKIIE